MVTLLVGTDRGLFALDSDEHRRQWRIREPAHRGWQVYSVWPDTRTEPATVWAGLSSAFYGPHLQRARDCGSSWEPVPSPRFPEGSPRRLHQIWSLAAVPGSGRMRAGASEAALFSSTDAGGWEWNQGLEEHPSRPHWSPGAGGLCLHSIVQDPADHDRVFIGISAVGVLRSDDGGARWGLKNTGVTAPVEEEQPKYTEVMCCVHGLVQDPTDPARLYQQNHTGVYRSLDAGERWDRIESGLPSNFGFPIVMHPRKPRTLFLAPLAADEDRTFPGGRPGVYRTDDGGDNWVRTHRGLEDPCYSGVLRGAMTADAEDEPGIYFGTTGGDVYASLDEGEHWSRLPGRLPRVLSVAALTR